PSGTPSPRAAPRTNVVLPAPRSPVSATTSPVSRTEATAWPSPSMSSGFGTWSSRTFVTGPDGRGRGRGPSEQAELLLDRLGPLGQRRLHRQEVLAQRRHLRRRLASAVQD